MCDGVCCVELLVHHEEGEKLLIIEMGRNGSHHVHKTRERQKDKYHTFPHLLGLDFK